MLKTVLRGLCHAASVIAGVLLTWTGAALGLKPDDKFLGPLIKLTQEYASLIILVAVAITVFSHILRYIFRAPRNAEMIIQKLTGDQLDEMRKTAFAGVPSTTSKSQNRVTIFKFVQWKWWIWPWRSCFWPWGYGRHPGSGWLVIAHRSGNVTLNSSTIFSAPEDGHSDGVAGMAWQAGGAIRKANLPDLSQVTHISTLRYIFMRVGNFCRCFSAQLSKFKLDSALVGEYAKLTQTSVRLVWKRVASRRRNPTCILAMPIESSKNSVWGVLVLDSSNHVAPIDSEDQRFRDKLRSLTKALDQYGITRS